MLLRILSIASVILGLYLIISFFFMKGTPNVKPINTTYHLGCYDANNAINHSDELANRLQKIQSHIRQSTKLNMFNSKGLKANFDKDVRDVAKSFQTYLNYYYKSRGASRELINYQNSVRIAKNQFRDCNRQINFKPNDCVQDWQNFQNLKGQLDNLKKGINQLITEKQKKQKQISLVFVKKPGLGQDQIQAKYKLKIKQIQQKMEAGQTKLIQLRSNKNKIKIELSDIDINLNQLKSILYQCLNNQQLISYCIKITKQIHQIQQSAPKIDKKTIQKRLANKLLIIGGLQANKKKATALGNNEQLAKLERQLSQQKSQLNLLQSQVLNFETKQQSMCAMCSQDRIKQLKKNISNLQNRKADLDRQLIQVQNNIDKFILEIQGWKKGLDTIQQQKQKQLTNQLCLDEQCKQNKRIYIRTKEKQINELKKQIIDKKVQFQSLKLTYQSRLNRVKYYLDGIDKVSDCIRKKEYYEQLKKKKPKAQKIDYKMVDVQRSMIKQLNDFQL